MESQKEKTIILNGVQINTAEILNLIREGNKLKAISVIKDQTGAGLKESKELVDRLDNSTIKKDQNLNPQRKTPNENKKSSTIVLTIVLFVLLYAILYYFYFYFFT